MKYSKKTTTAAKGFGTKNTKSKRDEAEAHAYCYFAAVGISSLFHDQMQVIENDCLEWVQSTNNRDFVNNDRFFDLLKAGKFLEANQHASRYSPKQLADLWQEIERWVVLVRNGAVTKDPEVFMDTWGDVSPETVTCSQDAVKLSYRAGIAAFDRNMHEVYAERFQAQDELVTLVEDSTDWQIVDCGQLMNADGTAATDFRDVVFARGEQEVPLRMFHSPRRVESDLDIPSEIQSAAAVWAEQVAA